MKPNEINQLKKGDVLFNEAERVEAVGMVMRGKITAKTVNYRITLGAGSFIGLNDVFDGTYQCDYVAEEDSQVYCFPAESGTSIAQILSKNKDYRGLAVYFLDRYIYELERTRLQLKALQANYAAFLKKTQSDCIEIGKTSGYKFPPLVEIDMLSPIEAENEPSSQIITYYLENIRIPTDTLKAFYGMAENITLYHIKEQSEIIKQLALSCGEYEDAIEAALSLTASKNPSCLFFFQGRLAAAGSKKGGNTEIIKKMEEVIEYVNKIEAVFDAKTGRGSFADRETMESIYAKSLNGEAQEEENNEEKLDVQAAEMAVLLKDSLRQLFEYAEYPKEKAAEFRENIEKFINLPDRLESSDDNRRLRREIEKGFYDLYECVFSVAANHTSIPKVVELFFNYGFVDERLISPEQLIMLCAIKDTPSSSPCKIYTMFEWLKAVYTGKKVPSRNEMGLDYSEYLREEKKSGRLTDEEIKHELNDPSSKVHFEINNALKSTSRVTNGHFSIYVPILFEEMFSGSIAQMAITRLQINEAFKSVLDVDFSAFHREQLFVDEAAGVDRFVIQLQVLPEIIISPVVGQNGSMWQEIAEKKRDCPGRFFIPALCTEKLDTIMVKLFGNFRWELCKTMQGINWNNVQMKSMTSEYMDYLQFYRKNRDLTEEKREKIKLQIQRCRNNSREVFTSDYISWILAESNGSIRMNKITREIFATYVPFRKEYREAVCKQPAYEQAFARYYRETAKKLHEIDLKHKSIERQHEIPEKMVENYRFYKEN